MLGPGPFKELYEFVKGKLASSDDIEDADEEIAAFIMRYIGDSTEMLFSVYNLIEKEKELESI